MRQCIFNQKYALNSKIYKELQFYQLITQHTLTSLILPAQLINNAFQQLEKYKANGVHLITLVIKHMPQLLCNWYMVYQSHNKKTTGGAQKVLEWIGGTKLKTNNAQIFPPLNWSYNYYYYYGFKFFHKGSNMVIKSITLTPVYNWYLFYLF